MKYFLTILFSLIGSVSLAAYPYDAVCEIQVGRYGGSGTIIAVSETQALVLSCEHVVKSPGRRVKAYWPNVPGGFTSYGKSIAVGGSQDIAAFITQRPPGVRPVVVRLPRWDTGPFTNVGFPRGRGSLEWQQGKYRKLTSTRLYYTVARPVSGMSGGATFDRFGSLVGVIIQHRKYGGVSTSGRKMMEFLDKFRLKEGWQVGQPGLDYGDR